MESARAFDRVARDRAASREDARARFHLARGGAPWARRARGLTYPARAAVRAVALERGRASEDDQALPAAVRGDARQRVTASRAGVVVAPRDVVVELRAQHRAIRNRSIDSSIDRGALQTRKTRTPDAVARAARVNAVAKKRRARERRRARGNGLASTCVARVAVATRDPSRRRARPVGRMVASHNLH